jgi:hypothetical protein
VGHLNVCLMILRVMWTPAMLLLLSNFPGSVVENADYLTSTRPH